MHPGALVDSASGVGLAIEEIGKKWVVLLPSGDEVRLAGEEIFFDTPCATDPTDRNTAIEFLESASRHLHDLAGRAETDVLWELTVEDPTPFTVSFAADFLFSNIDAVSKIAAFRALRSDHVRFQARKRLLFRPREIESVEALKEAEERRAIREKEQDAFVDRLLALIDGDEDLTAWLTDGSNRAFIERLKNRAADPEVDDRELDDILKTIGSRSEYFPEGRRGDRGSFALLVHLGIWHEHFLLGLWREQIEREFPPGFLDAAHNAPFLDVPRRDRTALPTFTIDGASTRDFDDAITLEEEGAAWIVGVHIADVTARVIPGSELDRFARERATSIYLPTDKMPMLPPVLTTQASLTAGETRPVVSFFFRFDGVSVSPISIELSTIRVDQNLGYLEADALLPNDPKLQVLQHVHDVLRTARLKNGAVEIERAPEISVHVDLVGEEPIVSLDIVSRAVTRACVSELAIATGAFAARYCLDNELPSLYRGQEIIAPPDHVAALPALARSFAMLRTMKRSVFTSIPAPHQGLGLDAYSQATSPIRRYGDLFVLQQITHHLIHGVACHDREAVLRTLATIEHRTRAASQLERESTRYWTFYELNRTRPTLHGEVVEIREGREHQPDVFFPEFALKHSVRVSHDVALGESISATVSKCDARSGRLWLDVIDQPNEIP